MGHGPMKNMATMANEAPNIITSLEYSVLSMKYPHSGAVIVYVPPMAKNMNPTSSGLKLN